MADEQKVALITGGSRGIGAATARLLAADGVLVFVGFCVREDAAGAVVGCIREAGGDAELIQLDVRDEDSVQRAVEAVFRHRDRLDILINSAGVTDDTLLLTMKDEQWQSVIDTNAGGTFRVCRAAARFMLLKRRGSIVNLSSVAGQKAGRGHANYAASKGAVEAFTRAMAVELAIMHTARCTLARSPPGTTVGGW